MLAVNFSYHNELKTKLTFKVNKTSQQMQYVTNTLLFNNI